MTKQNKEPARQPGSFMTPKKLTSCRANIEKAQAAARTAVCTCEQKDGKHHWKCPIRWREYRAKKRLKKD